jgi:predicted Zn-dependent protease
MVWLALSAYAGDDPVLDALSAELARTMDAWRGDPLAPYFLSYRVEDEEQWTLDAELGALDGRSHGHQRTLDVTARVGSPNRDSSHPIKGGVYASEDFHVGQGLPLDGPIEALRAGIWSATEKEVRDAQERWTRIQANQVVKVADFDPSADFSVEAPVVDIGPVAELAFDPAPWEPVVREVSARLDADPRVEEAMASVWALRRTHYVVTSEGTRVREPRTWVRVALQASTTVDDGSKLSLYRWKDVSDPAELPPTAELDRWAESLVTDLVAMRSAPSGDPYSGPVLLRGRAAAVFVHEVLGHRMEGNRQKDDQEGQTFTDKIGQRILPATVSVYDDPTLATYGGTWLNGHYAYDEEGVPAQRATLVDHGVLKGFLMSRSPVEGFPTSNGHGRAQSWGEPVARMANTILETSAPTPAAELRKQLLAEIRAQGREYGLVVDEIDGGFTLTQRWAPNAFKVLAVTAWKVYADGRPDERVRGIDLVGTPLIALSNLAAVGDDPAVFDGFCGAESGMVPVSGVSPSLLLRTLEVEKKEKGEDRPPLLPKPSPGGDT